MLFERAPTNILAQPSVKGKKLYIALPILHILRQRVSPLAQTIGYRKKMFLAKLQRVHATCIICFVKKKEGKISHTFGYSFAMLFFYFQLIEMCSLKANQNLMAEARTCAHRTLFRQSSYDSEQLPHHVRQAFGQL